MRKLALVCPVDSLICLNLVSVVSGFLDPVKIQLTKLPSWVPFSLLSFDVAGVHLQYRPGGGCDCLNAILKSPTFWFLKLMHFFFFFDVWTLLWFHARALPGSRGPSCPPRSSHSASSNLPHSLPSLAFWLILPRIIFTNMPMPVPFLRPASLSQGG